jgi:hypothetical protein
MPSVYNLKIKATLDTSQVQQQLNKLKVPGSGGGGGGTIRGNADANKEIVNAAKAINLGKIAAGFNLFSHELENLSKAMGGNGLVSKFADLASGANQAITAFRAFGAAGGVAITALNLFAAELNKANTWREGYRDRARYAGTELEKYERADKADAARREFRASTNLDFDIETLRKVIADKDAERRGMLEVEQKYSAAVAGESAATAWMEARFGKGWNSMKADELYGRRQNVEADLEDYRQRLQIALEVAEEWKSGAEKWKAELAELESQRNLFANRDHASRRDEIVENEDWNAAAEMLQAAQSTIAELRGRVEKGQTLSDKEMSSLEAAFKEEDFWTRVMPSAEDMMNGILGAMGLVGQSAEQKQEELELPSWLDGMDERTNDWFHSIGGSIGGENNIQNQEFQLMQEITRLVRNIDQTQTQMNSAIQ